VKDKLIALRLESKILRRLEAIGKREDRAVSWLIRKAINEFLNRDGAHEESAGKAS
jgi:predicted transcriptional regulator